MEISQKSVDGLKIISGPDEDICFSAQPKLGNGLWGSGRSRSGGNDSPSTLADRFNPIKLLGGDFIEFAMHSMLVERFGSNWREGSISHMQSDLG